MWEGCVKGFGKKEMGLKENRAIQGSRLSHLCSGRREGGGGRGGGEGEEEWERKLSSSTRTIPGLSIHSA